MIQTAMNCDSFKKKKAERLETGGHRTDSYQRDESVKDWCLDNISSKKTLKYPQG